MIKERKIESIRFELITVKYTYDTYESVEEYLDKELKKLGVINDTKKEEPVNDAA